MNKTKIEWADMTWNPVTGCLHGCEYCYARGIAERFGIGEANSIPETVSAAFLRTPNSDRYGPCVESFDGKPFPAAFAPTIYPKRMGEPAAHKSHATIFVCSMADLFGEWVPDEWIRQVFFAAGRAMQHNYLFLTKNPARYLELDNMGVNAMFRNIWLGATVTSPGDPFLWVDAVPCHSFISIEPLLSGGWDSPEPSKWPEWAIIGAMTGPGAKQHTPKPEWVADIVTACAAAGVPVFMKNSLVPVVGESNMLRQWPESMVHAKE